MMDRLNAKEVAARRDAEEQQAAQRQRVAEADARAEVMMQRAVRCT
jgi:hypothetical protein